MTPRKVTLTVPPKFSSPGKPRPIATAMHKANPLDRVSANLRRLGIRQPEVEHLTADQLIALANEAMQAAVLKLQVARRR